jgi:hypothetical protein
MRFSLNATFLVLALAHVLVGPVNANENDSPKRHLLKRATDGFHKSALRHSAGLAQDLRIAFRSLSRSDATRASVAARSNSGSKPYCVSNPGGGLPQQTNSTSLSDSSDHRPDHSSSSVSATSTHQGSPSSTGSPATNPNSAQSNFHVVQSYVRIKFI